MANPYKYINPGKLALFKNVTKTGTQYTNSSFNKFGPSFSQENINFLELLPDENKEFWVKDRVCFHIFNYKTDNSGNTYGVTINHNAYFSSSNFLTNSILSFNSLNDSIKFVFDGLVVKDPTYGTRGYYTDKNNYSSGSITNILKTSSDSVAIVNIQNNSTKLSTDILIPLEEQVNFELHVKSDATAGIIELFINSKLVFTYTGQVLNGEDISSFYIGGYKTDVQQFGVNSSQIYYTNSSYYPIQPIHSSFILQNTGRIGMQEILEIPVKSVETDWTLQTDNSYLTQTSGKIFLQEADLDTFKANLNTKFNTLDKLSISSICVEGENSYYNHDTNLKYVKPTIKKNGISAISEITELNYIRSYPLITTPMDINLLTNTSWAFDDLSGMTIGITSVLSE
jgi:hypothetical protein